MDAYKSLSQADQAAPLGADDLELLAFSAYMIGQDDDVVAAMARAHRAHLDAGAPLRAVRCAFWTGISLALRGEWGPATGWFGRAQRLLAGQERDCAERGYLLLPAVVHHRASGEHLAAYDLASQAAELGERFDDGDLLALAVHEQGRALIGQRRVARGLELLDEAMVAVTTDELSPVVTGLVYCSVIEGCRDAYALRRAHEWTAALTRWCARQPQMVAFTGQCLALRAEILQLHGEWREALDEARRAGERMNQVAAAQAFYRQGELHRLRGHLAAAEEAYRDASRSGWEPQPGLALLRLAQGDEGAAAAAVRRALGETTDPWQRARLLPAYIEIMLATGETRQARGACRELAEISAESAGFWAASIAYARGAVALAEGDASGALIALRDAGRAWQELRVPYETARTRVLVGLACRALGDDDTALLELDAARDAFAQLGAAPDLARTDALVGGDGPAGAHPLTARELQVLRLVAAGLATRAIATELVLSERTVERHISNIFTKLGVASRAAATAYAYQHRLV